MIRVVAALLLCLHPALAKPVWIDTDPSVAPGGHEVDDGLALVQAFRSPELQVRGVSVVFGNAPRAEALPIAQQLVRKFGPQGLPVSSGAASASDLGRATDATRALAAALRKERLTLLVLGPATNIASLIRLHPELVPQIEEVVAVAGRRPGQVFRASPSAKPFRDLNFELDPEAFRVLLNSGVPLVLAPWEISSKVWLTDSDLATLASGSGLDLILDPARDWLALWKREWNAPGFNPFDTLAVGWAIAPEKFTCDRTPASIVLLPDDIPASSGPQPSKPYLLRNGTGAARVLYCHQPPAEFKADLLQRLRGPARAD